MIHGRKRRGGLCGGVDWIFSTVLGGGRCGEGVGAARSLGIRD